MMYLSLFEIKNSLRKSTYAMLTFLTLNAIAWFIPSVAVCHPTSEYWSARRRPGACIDYNVVGTWISLPHIVSDIVLIILPLPVLWGLQLKRAKNIGLIVVFFAGSMSVQYVPLCTSEVHADQVTQWCYRRMSPPRLLCPTNLRYAGFGKRVYKFVALICLM